MSSTPPSGQPDYIEIGREPRKRPRRGLVVGIVVGVVVALGLPLGAFAVFRFLGGGGTQPHDVLPANAIGYVRMDLDPSGAQKIDAVRFLRNFPAFEKYTKITDDRADVREAIFDALLENAPCRLDYQDDIAPWLGERLGVAVTAPAGSAEEPDVVAAVQVTDEQAAQQGMERLRDCDRPGTTDAVGGWAYLDGYMIVAETEGQAVAYADAAERASLAGNDQFRRDMERLGEQGVASAWFSGDRLYQAFRSQMIGDPGPAGSQFDLLRDQVRRQIEQSYRSGAVAFRFDDRYVEVATVLTGDGYQQPGEGTVADMRLPETTALAFGFAGGAEYVDRHWDMMQDALSGGTGTGLGNPDRITREMERATGLALPADLQTLLGDSFTVALDGAGLDFEALGRSCDLSLLDLGVRATTDTDGFTRVVRTLEDRAAQNGVPVDLVVQGTDEGAVAALNDGYAAELTGDGSLADADVFTTAVPDADEAQGVFFVNFDMLEQPLLSMFGAPGPEVDEFTDNLTRIQAFGVSARTHDGYSEGSLRITVAD